MESLLEDLSSLAATGWPAEAGRADDEVPLDGGAARRFVHRVRLREAGAARGHPGAVTGSSSASQASIGW